MSSEVVSTLKAQLELKENQLALIEAMDAIRDELSGRDLLPAITQLLADWFESKVALLYLCDRWTTDIRLDVLENRLEETTTAKTISNADLGQSLVGKTAVEIIKGSDIGLADSWHLMGVGIEVSAEKPLGSFIIARPDKPFSKNEIELFKSAEMKLDSTIVQSYKGQDLEQRINEIETIYRIDHIRDLELPFDEMLNKVLAELINIVGAEIGYVMLYDTRSDSLALHASTLDDLLDLPAIQKPLYELGDLALQEGQLIHQDKVSTHLQSVMCLPLIMNQQRIGVIGVINGSNMTPFNSADERLLNAIGSQMDTAIFEGLARRRLRKVLGRSVGPNIMDQLLANSGQDLLKGERRVVTVLYADIRSSTQLATHTDPELLVAFMNYFLEEMTSTVIMNEGTIDKFIGDEVMALFNAPVHQHDHALRAVRTGLAMQKRYEALRSMWRKLGVDASGLGIGIATGELVVGEIGSTLKSEYTAIGQAANLGARVQGAAKGGQVLVCETTFDMVQKNVSAERLTDLDFQGINGRSTVYDIKRVLSASAPKPGATVSPTLDAPTHMLNLSSIVK